MYNIPLDEFEDIERIADWVELMITINQTTISKSQIISAIEMVSGEEPAEAFIDDILVELTRRQELYGYPPPYQIVAQVVSYLVDYKQNPEYAMCLLLSLFGNAQKPSPTGKLFERISNEAILNYTKGETLLFGHPSQKTVADITGALHEKFIQELPSTDKDAGLDIVAWISFKDQRPSQVVILFQCAAGKNWDTKLTHLSLPYWRSFICWEAEPCRGFTAPVIIPDKDFEKKAYHGGILLDRARIYKNTFSNLFKENLKTDLLVWVDSTISKWAG